MNDLQVRVKALLKRPIPDDMDYVPDSLAERFLAQYAETGRLALDGETAEILFLIVNESASDISKINPGEHDFMTESHAILQSILDEEIARPSWPAPYLLITTPSEKKPWWKLWWLEPRCVIGRFKSLLGDFRKAEDVRILSRIVASPSPPTPCATRK
jgi:hypothetical protein